MSEEEIDVKIRRLERQLEGLKKKREPREEIVRRIRKREFLCYLSELFNEVTLEGEDRVFNGGYWSVRFPETEIRFVKRSAYCSVALGSRLITIFDITKNGGCIKGFNNLSIYDYKLIGRILQVAEFDKLHRATQIYLDSSYPETLQSVLLILGTLKDSVFNLIGKNVTKIICQLALRGCLVK
jgi:hypothetical protein